MSRKPIAATDSNVSMNAAKPLQLNVYLKPGESDATATARTFMDPVVNSALTVTKALAQDFPAVELASIVEELQAQCANVAAGRMGRADDMLTAQAHSLDALFHDLTRVAYQNLTNLDVGERLFRLALKAQSQSRATWETLALVRNPPMVIARQANVTSGPQQINNEVVREI